MQQATFGMGCFWGPQHYFKQVPGVVETAVGYMGGYTTNPTYKDVCSGSTGHAEVVHIRFDETKTSYAALLREFFSHHNPTQVNRQGPDVGDQYRSVIFYHTPTQQSQATHALKQAQDEYDTPIATKLQEAKTFYRAEEYHQDYLASNQHACSF